MARLPFFVEVLHSRENAPLAVCQKVMALLFKRGIAPLPFGAALDEILPVLGSLKKRRTPPAIFVINTFWAEEVLLELDKLMGSTPALFFQRELFMAGPPGRKRFDESDSPTARDRSSLILQRMRPRPLAVWTYGSKTSDALAEKAAECLARFLQDGDFERLLRCSPQSAAYERALTAAERNFDKLHVVFEPEPAKAAEAPAEKAPALDAAASPAATAEAFTGSLKFSAPAAPPLLLAQGKTSLFHARGIHGSLENMGLSSLLIILEMEKKSGELVLIRPGGSARFCLSQGRVVDACIEAPGAASPARSGTEAVYYALAWTSGPFDFTQRDINIEDKINMPTTALLMEGARRADEAGKK